jgi:hypothetical protein
MAGDSTSTLSYSIESYGMGWYRVVLTTPDGQVMTRDGFVNERAARRWAMKDERLRMRPIGTVDAAKVSDLALPFD